MLKKKFEMWPANLFPNATLIKIGIYITNLDYLENRPLCFTELLDNSMEELNKILVGLNIAAIISKTNN